MVNVYKAVPIIELYLVCFGEPIASDCDYEYDDGGDDGGQFRIDWDDLYCDELYEPDLFDENNDVAGPSVEEDMEKGDEVCGEGSEESEGDEEYVEGGEESQKEIGRDNDGEEGVRSRVNCVDNEPEDDDLNLDMHGVTVLYLPPTVMRRPRLHLRGNVSLSDLSSKCLT
jgi:hypothetical protein